ncbi:MAG: ABC transporter ATP-binding protein [Thermodesulfovibrionales bacterium]
MAGLRAGNLTKSFGSAKVLDTVSFEVGDGEFCILVGPSGCGKSTILRIIAGLERQDGGSLHIGDREVTELSPRERDIAMVFQSYALYPHMNVYDNMGFALKMRKTGKQEIDRRVRDAAAMLGIEELLLRKPRELSGGQRQRVAIGRAIVRQPMLFLFDEPLSNLDAKLRAAMRVELATLHRRLGSTMIYVTHDQVEAMTLGEKIILLSDGKIQQIGPPHEVYERPSNIFVASFIGSPQMNFIDGEVEKHAGRVTFRAESVLVDLTGREGAETCAGSRATMGIRPEALVLGEGALRGTVDFVERLGSESVLYVVMGGARLTARFPGDYRGSPGENVAFSLAERGVHLFMEGRLVRSDELRCG